MLNVKDRLSELDVLLDNLDNEDWLKIPEDIITQIKDNKNKNYNWEYDSSIPFEDHEINKDTLMLFLLIMYKYVANNEEKKEINTILKNNTAEYNEKYSSDIFTKKFYEEIDENNTKEPENIDKILNEVSLVEYKENIFTKFKNFIFKLLHKKS